MWATSVALDGNQQTPEYAQAMRVAMLNKERNDRAVRPLRDQWLRLKGRRQTQQSKPDEYRAWRSTFSKKVAELQEKSQGLVDDIYEINKPEPHVYEVSKIQ